MKPSKEWFGTQAVLRVSFGNFAFFTLLAILMVGVEDQRDIRDGWHHGGWMVKFIAWGGLIAGAFLLPNSILEVYGECPLTKNLVSIQEYKPQLLGIEFRCLQGMRGLSHELLK